ncbi:MAG: hypothetical protein ACK55I_02765, partial [bacterium]
MAPRAAPSLETGRRHASTCALCAGSRSVLGGCRRVRSGGRSWEDVDRNVPGAVQRRARPDVRGVPRAGGGVPSGPPRRPRSRAGLRAKLCARPDAASPDVGGGLTAEKANSRNFQKENPICLADGPRRRGLSPRRAPSEPSSRTTMKPLLHASLT